jgi:hypothetical protein
LLHAFGKWGFMILYTAPVYQCVPAANQLQTKLELHTLLTAAVWPCHICGAAQAYELLQGNLVRFSTDTTTKDVPTAVLVHGILGSKRNLNSFARMIVEVSSSWSLQAHVEVAYSAAHASTCLSGQHS